MYFICLQGCPIQNKLSHSGLSHSGLTHLVLFQLVLSQSGLAKSGLAHSGLTHSSRPILAVPYGAGPLFGAHIVWDTTQGG